MGGICDGRVAIVTGAGRGIGREHALELARQGARVVVNDVGAELDGSGGSESPAGQVVEEIRAAGGEAVANGDDVADWAGARRLIETAVERFGRLDVLVNNAGIIRDSMLVKMEEEDWDAVIRVHLKGTFATSRFAALHWRDRRKAGEAVDARIVNTSSGAGLFGNVGQVNYSAAKGGIILFTLTAAMELERYGVTVNAIAPGARTRMTERLLEAPPAEGFDTTAPQNVSPFVVWLASGESAGITGRVFEVRGGLIGLAEGWTRGPRAKQRARWNPAELGPVVRDLVEKASRAAPS